MGTIQLLGLVAILEVLISFNIYNNLKNT